MYDAEKRLMREISAYAGQRKDYVQGGGGNTSVKFDGRLMAIKASGYLLSDITEEKGYVTVDAVKIRRYYDSVDLREPKDYEKESLEAGLSSIALLPGMENKRPSVEVGFHSYLPKCVIHTHSVYANILCCCKEGKEEARAIMNGLGLRSVFLPYVAPGLQLTLAVREAAVRHKEAYGAAPDAIFLENHGLIVADDNAQAAIDNHEKINLAIRVHYALPDFPEPMLTARGERQFESGTEYLKRFVRENHANNEYFAALKLYPDQLVYIGSKLGSALRLDADTGDVFYTGSRGEAQTVEETLLGAAYVIREIARANLTLQQMSEQGADFINNWESEKYRASLVGK